MAKITRCTLTKEKIDMNILLKSVLADLQRTIDEAKVSIIWSSLPNAIGDPGLIRQIWKNLIDNAIKFTRSKAIREIKISGTVDKNQSIYQVTDTGLGFNQTYISKLFKPFYTLHSEEEFANGGGIGLAIVERIVKRHGGKVWAEGVEGVGATFYFSLPIP
jgi:signal transduction histidine kinase